MKKFFLYVFWSILPFSTAFTQGIEVHGNTYFVSNGSPYIIIKDGGLFSTGTFSPASETFIFSGSQADSILGDTLLAYNVSIKNTGGITDSMTYVSSNDFTIDAASQFLISSNVALTVHGTLSNAGSSSSLWINSDAGNTGSLISDNDDVPHTLERYMLADTWHIISPSASGMEILPFLQDAGNSIANKDGGTVFAMSNYNESADDWEAFFTDGISGFLSAGTAYQLRRSANGTVEFVGNTQNSNTVMGISRSGQGWNGIGNPFTSAIRIRGTVPGTNSFLGVNADQMDPSYAALYIWDDANTEYKILNNSETGGKYLDQDFLSPGQGFFVRSKSGGGNISFTQEMKDNQSGETFYKKNLAKTDSWLTVEIKVSNGEITSSTLVLLNSQMTRGLDITYDAGLLGGNPNLKAYTHLIEDNGVNFAIQCLPDLPSENYIIPLGISGNKIENLTIFVEEPEVPEGYVLLLEDREKELFTDLLKENSSYTTDGSIGYLDGGRFFLHISTPEEVNSSLNMDMEEKHISIYSHAKTAYSINGSNENLTLEILDLSGRKRYSCQVPALSETSIPLQQLQEGIYIFRLFGNDIYQVSKHYIGD